MLGLGRCLQGRASDSPNAVPVSVDNLSSHMLPIVALSFESHESESVQQIYSLDLSIEYRKCYMEGLSIMTWFTGPIYILDVFGSVSGLDVWL